MQFQNDRTSLIEKTGTGSVVKHGTGSVEKDGTGDIVKDGTGAIGRTGLFRSALLGLILATSTLANTAIADIQTYFMPSGVMSVSDDDGIVEVSWHRFSQTGERLVVGSAEWADGYAKIALFDLSTFIPGVNDKANGEGTGNAEGSSIDESWATLELIETEDGLQGLVTPHSKELNGTVYVLDLSNPERPEMTRLEDHDL
jgi:hypothetical protein